MVSYMKMKHNHIILHDGIHYRVFERLGKNVPFEAYNPKNHLGIADNINDVLVNTSVPLWDIEKKPYEVIFNE